MIKIERLGHVLLRTRYIQGQIEFYCNVLGFEILEYEPDSASRMAFLALKDSSHTIDLLEVDQGSTESQRLSALHHIAFEVKSDESLREAYFYLKKRIRPSFFFSALI